MPPAPRATVLLIALVLVAAMGGAVARAASIGASTRTLGAGGAAVVRCDSDGIVGRPGLSGTNVVGVIVTGVAPACGGRTISATVTGATTQTGSATIPGGGGTVTVTLPTAVALAATMRIDLVVVGP